MTTGNLLTLIGWCFLIMSWVVPYVMKKMIKDAEINRDRFVWGMIFSAIALICFVSNLIIALMK